MSGQSDAVIEQPKPRPTGKLSRAAMLRRNRWFIQIGCLPFTCLLTGCLLLVVNFVFISKAPTWVTNPAEYLMGQRITGSLGTLVGLHLVGTWLLGVSAAIVASAAAAGQGVFLRQRLAILRRRVIIVAWAVFLLRWILLITLVVSIILSYTHIFETRVAWGEFRSSTGIFETATLIVFISISLIHWLSGPFLRLRFSLALGALAATWADSRDGRSWLALTARMAAGMLGSLALLWGGTLGIFIVAAIRQPFSTSNSIDFRRVFFSFLPEDSWGGIVFLSGLSVIILIYMMGQLALPPFFLWLARRRLAARSHAGNRSSRTWKSKMAKTPLPVLVSDTKAVDG